MNFQEKYIEESVSKAIKKILKEEFSNSENNEGTQQEKLMVPNIRWMSAAFNDCNKNVFGGKLIVPKFSTKCDENEWGCYYPSAGSNGEYNRFTMKAQGTLCLNALYKRTEKQWISTLLHEMCHEYVYQNGISKFANQHGVKFWRIAKLVNEKVKGYGLEIKEKDDGGEIGVVKADGTEEMAVYHGMDGNFVNNEQEQGSGTVLCVIDNPNGYGYKCWVCILKENEIQEAKSVLQKLMRRVRIKYGFYLIQSEKLSKVQTSPSNLAGFGGNSYMKAVENLCKYYGEWNFEIFNSNNLTKLK